MEGFKGARFAQTTGDIFAGIDFTQEEPSV